MADMIHLDAKESIFFERELEYIKTQTYDVKHRQLKAFSLIPVSIEANRGASEITWRSFDMVGMAKLVADYANDFPRVDVYGVENTVKVKDYGTSYGYSIKEIRAASLANKRLDQRLALAARRSIDERLNKTALEGDSVAGIQGLINYSGISEYTAVADGTGSSKLWSTKDAAKILRDLNFMVSYVSSNTNGMESVDTLILPHSLYLVAQNTYLGSDNLRSVLTVFKENHPEITTIDWLVELETAGSGGTHRCLAYAKDPQVLTLEIPNAFESFVMPQNGLTFEVKCLASTAGVIVYRPLAVVFMDGV